MLAIGRALMARPQLLLLDEPSLGLAPLVVRKIFEIIREINAAGTTVFLRRAERPYGLGDCQSGVCSSDGADHQDRFGEGAAGRSGCEESLLGWMREKFE